MLYTSDGNFKDNYSYLHTNHYKKNEIICLVMMSYPDS